MTILYFLFTSKYRFSLGMTDVIIIFFVFISKRYTDLPKVNRIQEREIDHHSKNKKVNLILSL